MINKKLKQKIGFTIVELQVYMGIFAILLIVLTQIFVTTLNTQLTSQATSEVSQDSRYILARMSYDIHRADELLLPPNIGNQQDKLRFKIGTDTYEYNQTNNNLILNVNGTSYQLNSYDNNISNLQFKRLGNTTTSSPIVGISFTLKSLVQKPSGQEIKNIETVIGLRLE